MATIRERKRADGTTAYNVLWPDVDGDGKQKSKTYTVESEARELLDFLNANGNSYKAAAEVAVKKRSKAPTVRECIEWHIDLLGGEVEPGTVASYRGMVKTHFTDTPIGNTPIDVLTKEMVRRWFDTHPRSPKTRKNIHALMSAALTRAVESGQHIKKNPAKGIRSPKSVKKSRQNVYLTKPEAAALVEAMPDHYKLFMRVLLGTGLRFGEATALKPDDFQYLSGRLTLRVSEAWKRHGGPGIGIKTGAPKTEKGNRTITLPKNLAADLQEHLKTVKRGSDLLFKHPASGKRIQNGTFHYYVWGPTINKLVESGALMRRPTIHDLRHTHASRLIEAGVDLPTIQERMGHENIQTTVNVYGHLAIDADAKAADLLDD